jgi:glycosyltransferase involved in cell wall biosynthesis
MTGAATVTGATSPKDAPPAVSVILPTHNRAALLARSVGSVLAQTWSDLELIVVDDGSTDDIAAALRPVRDGRLRLVRLPDRVGGARARNAGLLEARGRFIAFQDSDDEWLPTKLEKQMAAFAAAPADIGVVYCACWREVEGKQLHYPRFDEPVVEGDLHAALLARNFIATPCAVARREVLDEVGGFDDAMPRYQDWDLWVRVARQARFTHLPEELVVQHEQADSISRDLDARLQARLLMLHNLRKDLRRHRGLLVQHRLDTADLLDKAGRQAEARSMRWAAWRARPWDRVLLLTARAQGPGQRR